MSRESELTIGFGGRPSRALTRHRWGILCRARVRLGQPPGT
jgi:hypothetical protein